VPSSAFAPSHRGHLKSSLSQEINIVMAEKEFILVKQGKFVGATAKYDDQGSIIQLALDEVLPHEYVPH
jgi:hypothetical protein